MGDGMGKVLSNEKGAGLMESKLAQVVNAGVFCVMRSSWWLVEDVPWAAAGRIGINGSPEATAS